MKWSDLHFFKTDTLKSLEFRDGLPAPQHRLRAFDLCPYETTRIVVLGQDPYHTKYVADGLCFSTWPHIRKRPPSLNTIFREYQRDLGYPRPATNDLSYWARNGVLLLNT